MKSKQRGFTLVELLIVILIIGLLAGVAFPSYQAQVAKAKRAEAAAALLEAAQALERFYSVNGSYLDADGNLAAVFSTTVPDSGTTYYNITATASTANSFTLRATPANSMLGDGCGNFELNSAGAQALDSAKAGYTVADCWRR